MLKRDGVICGPLVCQVRKGKVLGGKGGGAGGLVVTLTTCGLKGMEKLFIESVRIDKSAHAGANPQPQPARSQDNGNCKLILPHLNRLCEAFKRSQVSPPASSCSQDQQPTRTSPIPSQRRLTQQPPINGVKSSPCVNTTLARVLRSSASSTCLRRTRPRSRTPLFALR